MMNRINLHQFGKIERGVGKIPTKIMTKKIIAVFLALLFLFLAVGCGEVKPITNSEESTIIKDAKSADEFIKKNDLDSLAYAYIYNLKSGLDSYYSATTGTISAKVLFIDYLIDFTSDLIKKGNAFYCKEHSASALMNVDTEYYLNSNDKIVHSTDLKNYTVYSTEDFLKIDYSPAQYTIAGLVFTDESILKAELVSNENGVIAVKYKLDDDKATSAMAEDVVGAKSLAANLADATWRKLARRLFYKHLTVVAFRPASCTNRGIDQVKPSLRFVHSLPSKASLSIACFISAQSAIWRM